MAACLCVCAALEGATLTLNPASGAVSGVTGATTGWGFTISHSGTWIVVTSANFCTGSTGGGGSACVPATLGGFTDYISGPGFTVVGPSPDATTVTRAFSAAGTSGVGGFLISGTAGQSATGRIVLTYDVFSRSPNDAAFNPDTDTVSTDNYLVAAASVTVVSSASPVPAPPSLWLVMVGAAALGARALRQRRRRV
jgi:hypothetical protein